MNERQVENVNECTGVLRMNVDGSSEDIDGNGSVEQSKVVAPIQDSVVQLNMIENANEEENEILRFELKQWSYDKWEKVSHCNVI